MDDIAKLVNRMRLQAEDLHLLVPASETVKCLSLGADALERLAFENETLRAANNAIAQRHLAERGDKMRAAPGRRPPPSIDFGQKNAGGDGQLALFTDSEGGEL